MNDDVRLVSNALPLDGHAFLSFVRSYLPPPTQVMLGIFFRILLCGNQGGFTVGVTVMTGDMPLTILFKIRQHSHRLGLEGRQWPADVFAIVAMDNQDFEDDVDLVSMLVSGKPLIDWYCLCQFCERQAAD